MKTYSSHCLLNLAAAMMTALFVAPAAFANGFTEPPAVLYGKVIHVDAGATYQVARGRLSIELVNETNPTNRVSVSTDLGEIGPGGTFSYRIEIPQKYLPATTELGQVLAVSSVNSSFRFASITVDGSAAEPLDSAQSLLATSFSKRGSEYRLDLKVTLPQLDTDGDGIPDWWENLHDLNPLYAGDASADLDSDGWSSLIEFGNGTDPNSSNFVPTITTTSLLVPIGGRAGLHLAIEDSDTLPENINLSLTNSTTGLEFFRNGNPLANGAAFTYADVLAGNVYFQTEPDFIQVSVPMTLQDTTLTNAPSAFSILIKGFSPGTQLGLKPALWLDRQSLAAQFATNATVAEWLDGSANARDGYQPFANEMPTFLTNGPLTFAGNDFLYLDDRNLRLTNYSAFLAFAMADFGESNQTIFNTSDLRVSVGGDSDVLNARTIRVLENNRKMNGPALDTNGVTQLTIAGGTNASFLTVVGQTLYRSATTTNKLDSAYATIGARQRLADNAASENFTGGFYEILLYNQLLDAGARSRNEDYQLSRWSSLMVWDFRNETAPLIITGTTGERNSLNGGWSDDQLVGRNLADILRGGPGVDLLTGGSGGDRFQFFKGHGNDVVSDFSEASGDIIDLTPIFADLRGSPDSYINVRVEITRSNNIPVVNSILELDHDGVGQDVDQTITLHNQRVTQADLPRLVGEGVIQLGGPQYDTAVSLIASEARIIETEIPRTITLTRTGNLDAALTVDVSFVGTADIDSDYQTSAGGSSVIRTITFARGEISKNVNLTPIQDTFAESEKIEIGVLAHPQITSVVGSSVKIDLEDAPALSIGALSPFAQRLGQVPGLIQISRTGPVTDALDISLQFSGSAMNGNDYDLLSPTVSFPAGVRTVQLGVRPTTSLALQDRAKVAQISILPDLTRFTLTDPWAASVLIVDAYNGQARTFDSFRQNYFPGNSSTNLGSTDSDGDFFNNLLEYVYGTDPNQANAPSENKINTYNSGGFLEIHATTASGLTDIKLALQASTNLTSWQTLDDIFTQTLDWRTDGRVQHRYRSKVPIASLNQSSFYRLAATSTNAPTTSVNIGETLGVTNRFLARTGAVWFPTDGNQIVSPKLTADQSSEFATFVTGAFSAAFEWRSDLGATDELVFFVDNVEVGRLDGSSGWSAINYNLASSGVHHLRWRLQKNDASSNGYAWLRNVSIAQP